MQDIWIEASQISIFNVENYFSKIQLTGQIDIVKIYIIGSLITGDVIMGAIASQFTSLKIVYSAFYSDPEHQSSASLAFVWGIHWGPVNSPHKWPLTRKMFTFDDVIMLYGSKLLLYIMSYCIQLNNDMRKFML